MKYTAEEVRAMAKMVGDEFSPHAGLMLTAYAERIKADEAAKPFAWWRIVQPGGVVIQADRPAEWNGSAIPLFTHPPAQAAQVDKPPRLGGCCCGEPCTLGVVHRTDGPCFRYADPAAHPTTNSPETDNKLVGGVVVPREALIYVTDLLAERKHGPSARSPAHNARRVVEYWLTAALQEKGK